MPTMLPALPHSPVRLADVLTSALEMVRGRANRLGLEPRRGVLVIAVDGLGIANLREREGHARFLGTAARAAGASATIVSGFPSTTTAQLTSLGTGLQPGAHGLVGYSLRDPVNGRVFNLIRGWHPGAEPEEWQPHRTVFERAADLGVRTACFAPSAYKDSGLSRVFLRGALFHGDDDVEHRLVAAARCAARGGLVYAYVADLDSTGHHRGWQSEEWAIALERTDAAISAAVDASGSAAVLVTADHGMVDVRNRVRLDGLLGALRMEAVAGEPRCPQIYLPDRGVDAVREWAWKCRAALDSRLVEVVVAEDAIDAGWLGPDVSPAARARMGDVLLPCVDLETALYVESTASKGAMAMVGQHGSITRQEMEVPLLAFGTTASSAFVGRSTGAEDDLVPRGHSRTRRT